MAFRICIRWGNPVWDHVPCLLDLGLIDSCDGCSFLKVLWDPPLVDNETSGS